MAFGFLPKYKVELPLESISSEKAFYVALESAKKLSWDIGTTNKTSFLAYTKFSLSSWSEEVKILIDNNILYLSSECKGNQLIDLNKNKRNIEKFIKIFNTLKEEISEEDANQKLSEITGQLQENYEAITEESHEAKTRGFIDLLIPSQGYLITPWLIYLNVAVFILMVMNGVGFFLPSIDSMLTWGANFKPLTLEGQSWRIFTSFFIHFGIIHLLFNMYALIYIGTFLEPYLGKARFLSAYILAGIIGSVTSLYWNDNVVSAGASGAVFGMYGVFLAMLTTNLIEKAKRKAMVTSISVFVGYNLLSGLQGSGIDNAAHIGGLVCGMLIGYSFYPSLVKPHMKQLKLNTILGLTAVVLIASLFVIKSLPNDLGKYNSEMVKFAALEAEAIEVYSKIDTAPNFELMSEIQNVGLINWKKCSKIIKGTNKFDLPEILLEKNKKLLTYCDLRIKTYKLMYSILALNSQEASASDYSQLEIYNKEIETLIAELTTN